MWLKLSPRKEAWTARHRACGLNFKRQTPSIPKSVRGAAAPPVERLALRFWGVIKFGSINVRGRQQERGTVRLACGACGHPARSLRGQMLARASRHRPGRMPAGPTGWKLCATIRLPRLHSPSCGPEMNHARDFGVEILTFDVWRLARPRHTLRSGPADWSGVQFFKRAPCLSLFKP